jgi:rhodanese-related sulfurtransferase
MKYPRRAMLSAGRTAAQAALPLLVLLGMALAACSQPYAGQSPAYPEVRAADSPALLRERPELLVIDVRTPREFAGGHLEGALNLDASAPDFEARLRELDPAAAYLVYCRSGNRSSRALPAFRELGFTDVTHMADGLLGWNAAGLPLVK